MMTTVIQIRTQLKKLNWQVVDRIDRTNFTAAQVHHTEYLSNHIRCDFAVVIAVVFAIPLSRVLTFIRNVTRGIWKWSATLQLECGNNLSFANTEQTLNLLMSFEIKYNYLLRLRPVSIAARQGCIVRFSLGVRVSIGYDWPSDYSGHGGCQIGTME